MLQSDVNGNVEPLKGGGEAWRFKDEGMGLDLRIWIDFPEWDYLVQSLYQQNQYRGRLW